MRRIAAGGPKPELVQAVVRAHLWLKQLQDGTYRSIEDLGRASKIHPKNIRLGLRLAFLAPKITKSVILSTQQDKKTYKRLNDIAEDPVWRTRTFIAERPVRNKMSAIDWVRT